MTLGEGHCSNWVIYSYQEESQKVKRKENGGGREGGVGKETTKRRLPGKARYFMTQHSSSCLMWHLSTQSTQHRTRLPASDVHSSPTIVPQSCRSGAAGWCVPQNQENLCSRRSVNCSKELLPIPNPHPNTWSVPLWEGTSCLSPCIWAVRGGLKDP